MKEQEPYYLDALKLKEDLQQKFYEKYGHLSVEEMRERIYKNEEEERKKFNETLKKEE